MTQDRPPKSFIFKDQGEGGYFEMLPSNIRRCEYVKVNGTRCGSPAMRGDDYCYYHYNVDRLPEALVVHPLDSADAIQFNLTRLAEAIAYDYIDTRRAALLAYIFQVASCNLKQTDPQPDWEKVVTEPPSKVFGESAERQRDEEFQRRRLHLRQCYYSSYIAAEEYKNAMALAREEMKRRDAEEKRAAAAAEAATQVKQSA
jgi:hypothetical protein